MTNNDAIKKTPIETPSSIGVSQQQFSPQQVFLQVGSTTWRLAVPAIGGTILGVWADNSFDTKPWLTIVGVVIGAATAVFLVTLQIKAVKP